MEAVTPESNQNEEDGGTTGTPCASTPPKLPRPNALLFAKATIQGVSYDLDHLNPFSIRMVCGERTFTVGVIFSCHCFTEGWKDSHTPDLRYHHGKETRAFCVNRYSLSLSLPGMIEGLGNQTVYWNRGGNFFFWRNHPLASPYLVFFNAKHAREEGIDVLMNIDSAHLKPNMTQFAAPVRFTTLVEAKATGQQIKPGPARQIKRK